MGGAGGWKLTDNGVETTKKVPQSAVIHSKTPVMFDAYHTSVDVINTYLCNELSTAEVIQDCKVLHKLRHEPRNDT